MATVDERVANLEARVDEHARGLRDLRDTVIRLEERMDRRFNVLELRFTENQQRLSSLDDRFSRYFVWMLGGQVSTLAALVVILARN